MNTQKLSLLLTVAAWAVTLIIAPQARAADDAPAAQFIQKMGDKALMQLTDKSLPRDARETRTRQILEESFDVPTIARFALGVYWREATDAQKKEYLELFENMIVKTYATRFEDYSGQSFKVESSRDEDERNATVSSHIIQKGGPPVAVEWHVRKKAGQMKVVDVSVENISMSVTQRDDFASVIQSKGGRLDALLDSLRKRKAQALTEKK